MLTLSIAYQIAYQIACQYVATSSEQKQRLQSSDRSV